MVCSGCKLKFKIRMSCFTCKEIMEILTETYEIQYIGFHIVDEIIFMFIHNRSRMSSKVITRLLKHTIEIKDVSCFDKYEGEVVDSEGTPLKKGGSKKRKTTHSPKTIINNNTLNDNRVININLINLNPFMAESLDHITPDMICKLLGEEKTPRVLTMIGELIYSHPENVNFKTSLHSGFVKLYKGEKDGWVTLQKDHGFRLLMENLTEKSTKMVNEIEDIIPEEDMNRFGSNMGMIYECKDSNSMDDEIIYRKAARLVYGPLSEHTSDRKNK